MKTFIAIIYFTFPKFQTNESFNRFMLLFNNILYDCRLYIKTYCDGQQEHGKSKTDEVHISSINPHIVIVDTLLDR
jgi:hypothetical protein